mgnify:FL=1
MLRDHAQYKNYLAHRRDASEEDGMLENYLPVLIFMAVGIAFGLLPVAAGFLLAPRKPDSEKNSPYECGFEAFEDTRMRFDVRY